LRVDFHLRRLANTLPPSVSELRCSLSSAPHALIDKSMKSPEVSIEELTQNFPKTQGMPVIACLPGSSASACGILPGDVLIEVNNVPIDGVSSYIAARKLDADAMRVRVRRGEQLLDFVLQMASSTVAPINGRGHFSA
jgi:hypothetical protein